MPTYEYECRACQHRFEEFQSIMDDPIRTCPVCNGEVRRLISQGGGLLFKGTGFYITDYRNKASAPDSSAKPGKTDGGGDTPGSNGKKVAPKTDTSSKSDPGPSAS